MVADFNDGFSAACRGDSWTRFGFLARSYADVIASALAEWSSTEIFIIWRTAVLAALSIWAIVFVSAALEWPAGPATLWFVLQLSDAWRPARRSQSAWRSSACGDSDLESELGAAIGARAASLSR